MFFESQKYDVAVAQIPKCGINSIRDWLGNDAQAVANDELTVSTRVAFIRHPIERLKSAYSFFYWAQERGEKRKDQAPVESWQAFVDHSLTHSNPHWNPQIAMLRGAENVIFHRFENINEHWEHYKPGILGHENRATRLPVDEEYRIDELRQKYAEDLSYWEKAT